MSRLRPSPAMLVALLALFVALGSSSFAEPARTAAKRLITGKQVKNGSLSDKDLSRRARARLKGAQGPAGPTGARCPAGARGPAGSDAQFNGAAAGGDLQGTYPNPQLAPGSVGGDEVVESSLGEVPLAADAQTLDGLDSPAFVRSDHGKLRATRTFVGAGQTAVVQQEAGKYSVSYNCPAAPLANDGLLTFTPIGTDLRALWVDQGGANPSFTFNNNPVTVAAFGPGDLNTFGVGLLYASGQDFATVRVHSAHEDTFGTPECLVFVETTLSRPF